MVRYPRGLPFAFSIQAFAKKKTPNRAAFVFSLQSWLGESEDAKKNSSTPGYFTVGMSRMFHPYSISPFDPQPACWTNQD
jgi:hypothetical protein